MFDQWIKNITDSSGANSGNIYQDAARLGHVDSTQASAAGNEAAGQAKIDAIKRENANAAKDPNKARMILLPNNQGYAFYDGTGKRISINDFSLITGKRPDEILGDSPNPVDQKFVNDYKTLTGFTNAWVNGDKQTLAKMREADPQTFNNLISNYKSPGDVIKAFTQHWSNYYSPNTSGQGQSSATPAFAPQPLNAPDKTTAAALEGGPLSQVLTPFNSAAPTKPNLIESLNPFSGTRAKYQQYQDYVKTNPWYTYQQSLAGQ
jgi:hypothetical protein